jgi:hypothetical protein
MKKPLVLAIAIIVIVAAVVISLRARNSRQLEANIAGPAAPIGADFPREQRQMFAKQLEDGFRAKGVAATVTAVGENSTTVQMQIPGADQEKARMAASNGAAINDLRNMGFKQLTISNGKESWQVDLKN